MNFGFSEEQDELRRMVRRFLEEKSPETEVRRLMATAEGYDQAVWRQMADQLGLQAMIIPEEFGGAGFGYVELLVVLEEMGAALLCAPVLLDRGARDQRAAHLGRRARPSKQWLPSIASGETIATLALTEDSGRWDLDAVTDHRDEVGDGWTLSGHKSFVLDGHIAGLILVAAKTPAGLSLFAVEATRRGSPARRCATMDQTRKQARLEFDATPATLVGADGGAEPGLTRDARSSPRWRSRPSRSGGAQRVLDNAVEYAKNRIQFGRPIGSFQAIKHKCADMLLEVESAKSAAYYGAWAASVDDDGPPDRGEPRQVLLLGGLLPLRRGEHPDPRRHRLHLGAPRAPVLQAREELRAAPRRPRVPPRTAGAAARHLTPGRRAGPRAGRRPLGAAHARRRAARLASHRGPLPAAVPRPAAHAGRRAHRGRARSPSSPTTSRRSPAGSSRPASSRASATVPAPSRARGGARTSPRSSTRSSEAAPARVARGLRVRRRARARPRRPRRAGPRRRDVRDVRATSRRGRARPSGSTPRSRRRARWAATSRSRIPTRSPRASTRLTRSQRSPCVPAAQGARGARRRGPDRAGRRGARARGRRARATPSCGSSRARATGCAPTRGWSRR